MCKLLKIFEFLIDFYGLQMDKKGDLAQKLTINPETNEIFINTDFHIFVQKQQNKTYIFGLMKNQDSAQNLQKFSICTQFQKIL